MKAQKRNRFWELHSLLGISLGLPLFIIFVAGTLAFFAPESVNWTNPEFKGAEDPQAGLEAAVSDLLAKHPDADEFSVVLATPQRPVTDLYLEENGEFPHYWLDPATGELSEATPHDSDLFHFFVDLHYFEFIPNGIQLAGLIAALFFAIILTGLVYQWRTMGRDLQLRNLSLQGKSRWKRIHRFTSLLTLPFQVAYSVTGAALALGLFLAAPTVSVFFDGDQEALNAVLFPEHTAQAPPVADEPLFPVGAALAKAQETWGPEVAPQIVHIAGREATEERPASRTIMVEGKSQGLYFVGNHVMTMDENLEVLHAHTPTSHLGPMLIEALVNVHFASFNGFFIKIIFALFGLIVALSIGAGIYILLQRRPEASRLTRFLRVLTHWQLGGLPLACAASLLAVQLAPDSPLLVFWVVYLLSLVVAVFWKKSLFISCLSAAILFLLLPAVFALAHGESPLPLGTPHAWMISFFNVFFLLIGSSLLLLLRRRAG
ncbi:MAG: PepSY-associated TM helix domain-containing protein [Verrucomicrobiales bacterium]